MAKKTIERFVERAARLYELDRKEPLSRSRFGLYVRRWLAWAGAVWRGTGGGKTVATFCLL